MKYLIMVLILISLIISDVEHLVIYVYGPFVYLQKCYSITLPILLFIDFIF